MIAISIIPLLLATAAARSSFFFSGGSQKPLDTKLDVPGANPLSYCQNPEDYSLSIDKVDLTPNPPKSGQKLVIAAQGTFNKEVEEGACINLSVKYGLITLINTTANLCDQLKEVGEGCPIKGEKIISKEVNIPKEVPPGTYTVLADVYNKDNDRITCLQATVHFGL